MDMTFAKLTKYLDKRFDAIDGRFNAIDTRLDAIDGRLTIVEHRLDGIEERLTIVEHRLDGIDERLDGVERRSDVVESRLDTVNEHLVTLKTHLEALFLHNFGTLSQEMHNNTAAVTDTITRLNDYHDMRHVSHDKRLVRLEGHFAS